jgi:hypothetical protein
MTLVTDTDLRRQSVFLVQQAARSEQAYRQYQYRS